MGAVDGATVTRYLRRIGWDGPPPPPDAASLRALHEAHLRAVPFENLSIHLGQPIVLEPEAVLAKLLDAHRGGFCYELNGAFGLLLGGLGYRVAFLSAQVFSGDQLSAPLDHMVLQVVAGRPWLADVGFGDHSLHPLALDDEEPQADPNGTFQLRPAPGGDVDVWRDGMAQYRVDRRARRWSDFVPTCWWHQTSPESHFTRSLVCSLAVAGGRVTLSDRRLIETVDGRRHERMLDRDEEVLAAYRDYFGISLAGPPPHLPAGGGRAGRR